MRFKIPFIDEKRINKKKRDKENFIIPVSDNQSIYICEEFPEFINWNKNRPPDETRIADLKEYYIREGKDKRVIPGIIYAWDRGLETPLEIYDGIHRLMAAKELEKDLPFMFLLNVLRTEDENVIIRDFKNINKSCPVPSLYTEEDNTLLRRVVCENVVKELCNRYSSFVSPSRKPYRYNFNRDVTLEWLSELEIDWTIAGLSSIILQELTAINFIAKDFITRNKISVPKKCEYHNFYLWFLEKTYIGKKLEDSLKAYK